MTLHGIAGSMGMALVMGLVGCADHAAAPASAGTSDTSSRQIATLPTEGMWLPDALPAERLRHDFDFDPTPQWQENLRLAAVHIGASGAFVSPDGLVLTNHHVAAGGLQNISRRGKDYVADGFLARSRSEEIPLPGTELSVLTSIEDVTGRVNAAIDSELPPDQAVKARHAIFADIERQSLQQTGLQSAVVTLYGGARYHLYRYKRYSDIRVVFAPEFAAAFMGGDTDNFEYPRFDLDIALLRAYENGKPAHVSRYLRISPDGVKEGDLVFVAGHPGTTDRLLPVVALESMRDLTLPLSLEFLERQERVLLAYTAQSPEQSRQAQRDIFGIQNSLKAMRPRLAALRGNVIERKRREEAAMREQLRQRAELRGYDAAWDRITAAEQKRAQLVLPFTLLEQGRAFSSSLFGYARTLVRLSVEDAKPDSQRFPEYTQARRDPLTHRLLADTPVYGALEVARLTESLSILRDKLGENSPLARKILAGKTPEVRARELIESCGLAKTAERKRLLDGGKAAIDASTDPMIQFARLIDDDARQVRRSYESQVEEPVTEALTQINRARFALYGSGIYPDATGTLRLAFGIVKGYEQDGRQIAPWTTVGGAFDHERVHGDKPPYELPESWHGSRGNLALSTPLNFVSTADITNGNSGSPVVNRSGELVGVIFDSNRQGVANNFLYSDTQARAVSVDSRAILKTLKHVYHADALLAELTGSAQSASAR